MAVPDRTIMSLSADEMARLKHRIAWAVMDALLVDGIDAAVDVEITTYVNQHRHFLGTLQVGERPNASHGGH
jgi:hypothetical protein